MSSHSRPRFPVMKLLALSLSLLLLAQGCTPTADGAGVDKKALRKAAKKASATGGGGGKKKRRLVTASGNRVTGDSAVVVPYTRKSGYVVRGTDVLMFHPCGDTKSYFVVAGGPAMQRIAQRYKFTAQRPYQPVYLSLQVRFLNDTVTSGDFTFTRVADVEDVVQEDGSPKLCGPPTREALVADTKGR